MRITIVPSNAYAAFAGAWHHRVYVLSQYHIPPNVIFLLLILLLLVDNIVFTLYTSALLLQYHLHATFQYITIIT